MTSTTIAPPVTEAALLAGARAEVAVLGEVLWAARSPEEILDTKKQLELLRSTLSAVDAQLAREIEVRDLARADGWGSVGDYLTAITADRRGHGQAVLRTSRALTGELRLTWKALAAGRISWAQAEIIVATIDKLPVKQWLRAEGERRLLREAPRVNATELAGLGQRLLTVLDPEGDERRDERALARQERAAHLGRHLSIIDDGMGGVRARGRGTTEDAAAIKAALFPLTRPMPATDPDCGAEGQDPRDYSTRLWDALVEACQKVLDTEIGPDCHGAKPRVTLTMSYVDLLSGVGVGTLDTGEQLSASAVRRLCCDADITPIVLGGHSEILDVGRQQRLATAALWKALVARDRTCAFPGCNRPAIACAAHHIKHWLEGGETSLDNLCLLCVAHHQTIHNTPWQVRLNPIDRRPEFIPPAKLDPERRPIRHREPRE